MSRLRPEPTVVADANVLYSNDQRNVLMTLATERQIDLRWTQEIETEWVRALVRRMSRKQAGATSESAAAALAERFAGTARMMREALPSYDVPGYAVHAASVPKADAKDRHVAAAAVGCMPSTLITWNLGDFDEGELTALGVTLTDPDTFLCSLLEAKPTTVPAAVLKSYGFVEQGHIKRGQVAPTWHGYLDFLATRGAPNALPRFAASLRTWRNDETDAIKVVSEVSTECGDPDAEDPGPGI